MEDACVAPACSAFTGAAGACRISRQAADRPHLEACRGEADRCACAGKGIADGIRRVDASASDACSREATGKDACIIALWVASTRTAGTGRTHRFNTGRMPCAQDPSACDRCPHGMSTSTPQACESCRCRSRVSETRASGRGDPSSATALAISRASPGRSTGLRSRSPRPAKVRSVRNRDCAAAGGCGCARSRAA